MSVRWALSVLDWRSHAIDERAWHPTGIFKAQCGHRLMMVVELHERPGGRPCQACATGQFDVARAPLEGAAAALRLVSGPLGLPSPRRDD